MFNLKRNLIAQDKTAFSQLSDLHLQAPVQSAYARSVQVPAIIVYHNVIIAYQTSNVLTVSLHAERSQCSMTNVCKTHLQTKISVKQSLSCQDSIE